MSVRRVRELVERLPRAGMARLPTALDELPRLSEALGGPRILIKREDLSGLAMGGNKARELDFFIADAIGRGADVFIAGGGAAQSNHAVLCAAAARRAGMKPVMLLQRAGKFQKVQGNLLLGQLLGTDLRLVEATEMNMAVSHRTHLRDAMEEVAAEYRRQGHSPYVLPSSFHPLGAIGFVDCAVEMEEQLQARGIRADAVYLTSSGATQTGLALGAKLLGAPWRVVGCSPSNSIEGVQERMAGLGNRAAEMLGVPERLSPADIRNEDYSGSGGYGVPSPQGIEAIRLVAQLEGLFLDPIYSGKGMAGLIDHIRQGRLQRGQTVVFVHTGGLPALFAYHQEVGAL
ncbi:MAG TPA: pyridoxal-phosphate dependent enzyme [Symbiobacteriaceae bacterium]|nr:pyridoxal-phosphate dependent enzyme [Symbiobacteriaceae bacterium]